MELLVGQICGAKAIREPMADSISNAVRAGIEMFGLACAAIVISRGALYGLLPDV